MCVHVGVGPGGSGSESGVQVLELMFQWRLVQGSITCDSLGLTLEMEFVEVAIAWLRSFFPFFHVGLMVKGWMAPLRLEPVPPLMGAGRAPRADGLEETAVGQLHLLDWPV